MVNKDTIGPFVVIFVLGGAYFFNKLKKYLRWLIRESL
jgi:hypothetical protein